MQFFKDFAAIFGVLMGVILAAVTLLWGGIYAGFTWVDPFLLSVLGEHKIWGWVGIGVVAVVAIFSAIIAGDQ